MNELFVIGGFFLFLLLMCVLAKACDPGRHTR